MKILPIFALAFALLCAGCSSNLSRTEAVNQIMKSTPVRMGASSGRHIGSVENLSIMEIFTDGPRARVKFTYEIKLDKPEDSALFPDGKPAQDVWIGTDKASFLTKVSSGNFENFGSANFEKTDDGWKMRKINMDDTN
jgi:hypothetical protein